MSTNFTHPYTRTVSLAAAVAWANRAGAAACLERGTSSAMPDRAAVDAVG